MPLAVRRSFAGAAEACTLTSNISNSATSFSITGTTTAWPSTATGAFYMVIDPGLSTEEKVLVGARTTGSLSSVTRGVDGTSAAAHDAGATCYPILTAVDLNDANLLASRLSAKGDLISSDGTDPTKVAVGANNTRLVADSAQTSGIKWVADTQNTVVDAKGDLLVGSAADTVARLAVDTTNGAVLIADSTATNGVSWQPQNTGVRNLLYNGAMQVAQRGTSTASITTSNYYTADRWYLLISSLGTWTQSVASGSTDAPDGSGFRKSLKMLCTTADSSPAAGDYCIIEQRLEGQDLQAIRKGTSSAKEVTVSFWVKSGVTGTYIFQINDADNTRSVSKSYTISAADTWEFKTITMPADTTGAFDNDENNSVSIRWWLGAGSTFTSGTLNTTWQSTTSGNLAVGQVNVAAGNNSAVNYWQITGVQLNIGSVAAPFQFKSFEQEFRECQRYYYRIVADPSYARFGLGEIVTNQVLNTVHVNPVRMRATPHTLDQTGTASNYAVYSANVVTACTAALALNVHSSQHVTTLEATAGTGLTVGRAAQLLANNSTTAYIGISAELI